MVPEIVALDGFLGMTPRVREALSSVAQSRAADMMMRVLFRAIHIHADQPEAATRRSEAEFAICIEGTMIGAFDIQLEERRKGHREGRVNFQFQIPKWPINNVNQ